MRRSNLASNGNREFRPMGVMRESPALHFYLMQVCAFSYLFYRVASRNYTVFGILPADTFVHARATAVQFIPVSWVHWTTFQFLYEVLPRPGADAVAALQLIVLGVCLLGLIGVFPRWSAAVAFLVANHITGLMVTASADTDGETLVLSIMLILALSPSRNFYSWRNGFVPTRTSIDYQWPIVLLFMVVGAFYTFSGLNKLIDVGPHWPFVLHLDRLAARDVEGALFVFSHYRNPAVASVSDSSLMSAAAGMVSLIGELGFISILFLPRFRLCFVLAMSVMHVMVLLLAGINFVGSSMILLLCLDWNVLARHATLTYDADCGLATRIIARLGRSDWFHRLTFNPAHAGAGPERLETVPNGESIRLEDENGEAYYGADALEQAAARCPLLWPYALAMKVPGVIYLARSVYARYDRPAGRSGSARR